MRRPGRWRRTIAALGAIAGLGALARRLGAVAGFGLMAQMAQAAQVDVAVRTPQGAPVQDAVVWLEGRAAAAAVHAGAKPTELRQVDQEFDPFVTVVATGTRVLFPNRDRVKHHVYSFSPAKPFEIQLYSGTPAAPIVFDKAGVVVIGCNIHDWMLAYVVVLDAPWFAKSAASGRAAIAALPAGTYTLHVWHPHQKAEAPTQAVVLGSAQSHAALGATLELAPPPRKPRRPLGDTY